MKKSLIPLMATCLFVLGAVQIGAQTPPEMSPPAVLQIFREEVKPGKAAAHEAVEAAIVQAFARESSVAGIGVRGDGGDHGVSGFAEGVFSCIGGIREYPSSDAKIIEPTLFDTCVERRPQSARGTESS